MLTIAGPPSHKAQHPESTQRQPPHCDDGEEPIVLSCLYTHDAVWPRHTPTSLLTLTIADNRGVSRGKEREIGSPFLIFLAKTVISSNKDMCASKTAMNETNSTATMVLEKLQLYKKNK